MLAVISAEQKLLHSPCHSLTLGTFFSFAIIFRWQIAVRILGPATHFDLKDYVSGCLAIAGKDLVLLNNGLQNPVNPIAFATESVSL